MFHIKFDMQSDFSVLHAASWIVISLNYPDPLYGYLHGLLLCLE